MGPSPALESDSNNQDLTFLTEIKNEVPEPLPVSQDSSHKRIQSDLSVYLGMRRNSSFADYFEGDLSQNLLSRRHFTESSSTRSGLISTLVNKIRIDGQTINTVEDDGIIGKKIKVRFHIL